MDLFLIGLLIGFGVIIIVRALANNLRFEPHYFLSALIAGIGLGLIMIPKGPNDAVLGWVGAVLIFCALAKPWKWEIWRV